MAAKLNIKSFIDYIITFDNIDDILNNCKTQSEKGFIFERLFDIIIKFGFCDIFINYNHLIGNSNNGKLKILENINLYLNEKVLSGNSGGCSDITLQHKETKEYIFITSKYPKSQEDIKKEKSVDYYDVQKIIAMIDNNKHIYKDYKIYLVVPNKQKVLEKVKTANKSSNYITKYMNEENILDKYDLNKYFLLFKQDIIKNKNEDWQSIYLNSKENLVLRFHQELITQKTSSLIEEGNKTFLWGCKCRSGKTYMIGGIIKKQFEIKKKLNVLIITPAPTETAPQFTDDLFHKFKDFDKFKIHHIEGSKMIDNIELTENNIFIMSKQLLQNYTNNNTIMLIKNLKLDIIGFDENHFSGTTNKSKDILTSYSSKNTVNIYLTATYNKPLKEWNIKPECQMYWDIEDEQFCKGILIDETQQNCNLIKLKEKHSSEYIDKTIKYYTNLGLSLNDIFKSYNKMPDLHLITNMFDSQRYEIIKEKLNNENKMGFCFDTLFGLNKDKNKFSFENEVKTFLRYISGSNKEEDGDKTIFPRINYICSEKNSRHPFTQIWFLPSDNINEISLCLEKLMKQDLILKKYDIMCINRKNTNLAKDVKDEINKAEIEATSKGKLGLILLAGNMLSLGITINLCDLVILMNNALSSDKVFQQMYRCMTEGDNKKIGIVVDLNISRVLNTCINYTIYKNDKSIDNKMKYLIKNNLINIDIDMMLNKQINSDIIIKKLMDIWKEDPINSFITLIKRLDNDYEEFDNSTQKLINKTFTKSIKDDIVGAKMVFKDEDDEVQELPKGREKVIDSDNEHNNTDDVVNDKEIQISFTKDVLPYIIPLTCILTIKNNNMDFVKMLNDIKENPELLDTFDDQCLIWWNKIDLIDLIKDIVYKYFDKSSNTYNISVQFKMSLQSLIDNPKELLELINECLKPKDIEKKQFGEVFTPILLVNEMLDKLPIDVWKNKNLKWLDPASGMGNFPVAIYLRLMEGLKDTIKDETERKKHILENMLYMCELNKKNVLITKQIFDINNEYNLNIYQGDSLKLDYYEEFKIKEFDIIVGNPPYQEADATGDNKLYLDFTKICLNILKENGLLLFITPRNILEYLLLVEKNRKYIDNFYQLKYIAIETSNKYFPKVGSTFAYFLIEKKTYYEETQIEYMFCNKIETIKIMLKKGFKIPKILTKLDIEILSLLTSNVNNYILNDFMFNNKTQRIRKQHIDKNIVSIKETDINKIKIIDTINKTTPFPGKYYYYNLKDNVFDKDKLILSKKGYLMPYVDRTKSYTYSDNFKYIIDENLDQIKLLFDSNIVKYLLFQYSKNGFDSIDIIKTINKKDLNNIKTEADLYKLYNLTEEHINHIKIILSINKSEDKNNYTIIKDKKKNYYLINNKVYLINKNKSIGSLFGNYIDNKIIELKIVKYKNKEYILEDNIMYKIKEDGDRGSKCGIWNNGNVKQYVKQSVKKSKIINA